jgi:hypothetical protein
VIPRNCEIEIKYECSGSQFHKQTAYHKTTLMITEQFNLPCISVETISSLTEEVET